MLSTRSNFLRGFGRGVSCVCVLCEGGACALWTEACSSALRVRRCGVTKNLFAGVLFTGWSSCICSDNFGVVFAGAAMTLRKFERGLGLGCCVDGAFGARKRCGDGVCAGMVRSSFVLAALKSVVVD